jgi:hypothetical protein
LRGGKGLQELQGRRLLHFAEQRECDGIVGGDRRPSVD